MSERDTGEGMTQLILSNVNVYAAIAEEAFVEMEERLAEGRRSRTDGKGWVLLFDPSQKSFKSALVYITFSALWLDAILHLRIADLHGKSRAKEVDRKPYEEKLAILGIGDEELFRSLEAFRRLRREIVHEKAFFSQGELRNAQDEAQKVRRMMQRIREVLGETGR